MAKPNYFELEISKDLKQLKLTNPNLYSHRLLDTATMRYALNNPRVFNIRQPCDSIVLYNGLSFFIELKSSRSPSSYAWRYVRENQVLDLTSIENSDTKLHRTIYSYFFINRRAKGQPLKLYALRVNNVANLIAMGKKSIKWNTLAQQAIEIPRVKGTWDLLSFFENDVHN